MREVIIHRKYCHICKIRETKSVFCSLLPYARVSLGARHVGGGCARSFAQSCPPLCNPVDGSSPGFSLHGTLQARIQEWVAIFYSRGSSRPRNRTCISCIGRWILYHWTTWGASSRYTGGLKHYWLISFLLKKLKLCCVQVVVFSES